MSGLSASYTPGALTRLEARFLSGTLARKIAIVVCTVLAVAVSLLVELDWHHDRREQTGELVARVRADALRLAARFEGTDRSARSARAVIIPYAAGTSSLERVELLDAGGRVRWSSEADRVGEQFDTAPFTPPGSTAAIWIALAQNEGGSYGATRAADRVAALVPIHSKAKAKAKRAAPPERYACLALVWDTGEEARSAARRRIVYHLLGLVSAFTLGLLLWWLLARLVSRPLAILAQRTAREDFQAQDLGSTAARDDEIGALTRAFLEAHRRLDDRRAQIEERTARLEASLNAGLDGLAMATCRNGTWRLDHVNQVMAALTGRPAEWFDGRTVEEGLGAIGPRLVDPRGVASWVKSHLADPEFEGMRVIALQGPEAITEVSTRPVRDSHGHAFGRMWVLRDVTNARAHEQKLTRQNQELATLDLVGRRVSRSLDRRAILASAATTLCDVLDGAASHVLRVSPDGQIRALDGEENAEVAGWIQALERQRGAMLAGDVVRLEGATALPVRDVSGLVAIILLEHGMSQPLGADELGLLRRVLHPVDAALENARLFALTESQLVENQTLYEVSRSIGRADELDAILSEILRVVCERLSYRNAAVLLPDERSGELYVRASEGYHTNLATIRLPLDGPSVTALAFREAKVVNVPDVRTFPGYVAGSDDIRSELALPLCVGERVLGILDLESDRLGAFSEDDERLLAAISNQAAMVLSNAWLFTEARARATRFEAVNEIARGVSATLDPTRLARVIVSQLARVVPCERYAVLRYDSERRRVDRTVVLDAHTGLAHDGDELWWTFEEGIDPTTLAPHQAVAFPDLSKVAATAEARHVAQGLSSMVLVPIALDGVVQASIVAAAARPDGFTSDQITLLETVSWHVGVALKNAELFSRLQESYIQLNEAQDGLVRSEKLRALGEMASGVAHDFNNVLGAILARAQLLKQQAGPGDVAAELEIIERAALDGASTVRRLQDFTRVRTDREFQPVSMTQVARDGLSLTRGRWRDEAERAGVHYEVTTELGPVPEVAGEASELREVLTNIILNALDAMPTGGTLRLVTRRVETDTADDVVLEAIDSGEGMSPEVRARIFDPFFTTKGVRGVGLGLSVVYGIVQRHGGRIEVESVRGNGTTMRVVLPALGAATGAGAGTLDPSRDGHKLAAPPIRAGARASVCLRVLVVDDEPSVRTLLGDLLRSVGHEVVEMANGREALARLESDPEFDLVMTDLGMPDLSGWDVARTLAAQDGGMPVILVTGWGIQLDDQTLASSGVSAVVAKPFTIEEVLATVERVTRRAA